MLFLAECKTLGWWGRRDFYVIMNKKIGDNGGSRILILWVLYPKNNIYIYIYDLTSNV